MESKIRLLFGFFIGFLAIIYVPRAALACGICCGCQLYDYCGPPPVCADAPGLCQAMCPPTPTEDPHGEDPTNTPAATPTPGGGATSTPGAPPTAGPTLPPLDCSCGYQLVALGNCDSGICAAHCPGGQCTLPNGYGGWGPPPYDPNYAWCYRCIGGGGGGYDPPVCDDTLQKTYPPQEPSLIYTRDQEIAMPDFNGIDVILDSSYIEAGNAYLVEVKLDTCTFCQATCYSSWDPAYCDDSKSCYEVKGQAACFAGDEGGDGDLVGNHYLRIFNQDSPDCGGCNCNHTPDPDDVWCDNSNQQCDNGVFSEKTDRVAVVAMEDQLKLKFAGSSGWSGYDVRTSHLKVWELQQGSLTPGGEGHFAGYMVLNAGARENGYLDIGGGLEAHIWQSEEAPGEGDPMISNISFPRDSITVGGVSKDFAGLADSANINIQNEPNTNLYFQYCNYGGCSPMCGPVSIPVAIPTSAITIDFWDSSEASACINSDQSEPDPAAGFSAKMNLTCSIPGGLDINTLPSADYTLNSGSEDFYLSWNSTDQATCGLQFSDFLPNTWLEDYTGCLYDAEDLDNPHSQAFFQLIPGQHLIVFPGVANISSWWQSELGDIWANGNITSQIPLATCGPDLLCEPFLNRSSDQGFTEEINGVVITNNGSINIAPALFPDNVGQQEDWYMTGSVGSMGNIPSFDVWVENIDACGFDPVILSDISEDIFCKIDHNTSVFNNGGLPAGVKATILVSGDLTIPDGEPLTVGDNGFLMFFTKNNITIEYCPTTGNSPMQGIYLAEQQIIIPNCDTEFTTEIKGVIAGFSGVSLQRKLASVESNKNNPALKFTYDPDLIYNAPDELKSYQTSLREVNPQIQF